MSKNDDRILEYLCRNSRSRPREIRNGLDQYGITLRIEYVDDRIDKLESAGLITRDELRYSLTDRGKRYLVGEFDASSIQAARF